jgi:hypothetical protein
MKVRELNPEDIFALHPGIRFVGLAKRNGQVLFAKMRGGVVSHTPDSVDKTGLESHGRYFIDTAEQEVKWSGPLEYIVVRYEKYVVVFIPLTERYVLLSLEKSVPAESYDGIFKSIRALD